MPTNLNCFAASGGLSDKPEIFGSVDNAFECLHGCIMRALHSLRNRIT